MCLRLWLCLVFFFSLFIFIPCDSYSWAVRIVSVSCLCRRPIKKTYTEFQFIPCAWICVDFLPFALNRRWLYLSWIHTYACINKTAYTHSTTRSFSCVHCSKNSTVSNIYRAIRLFIVVLSNAEFSLSLYMVFFSSLYFFCLSFVFCSVVCGVMREGNFYSGLSNSFTVHVNNIIKIRIGKCYLKCYVAKDRYDYRLINK